MPIEQVQSELSALSTEEFRKLALSVVPQTVWLPVDEHHGGTLQWAKGWAHARGFTTDDVRQAIVVMSPYTVRRLLQMEQEAAEVVYEALLLEGVRAGEVATYAFREKRRAFREAI